jgi:hypothetical protein
LRSKFAELRPEPGERVRVAKGASKKKSQNGFNYWPFAVAAPDRGPETLDWDDPLLAGEADETADPYEPDVPADTAGLGEPERSTGEPANDDIPF